MKFNFLAYFSFICCLATTTMAQQSEVNKDVLGSYQTAIQLYEQNQFAAAQTKFESISDEVESQQLQSNLEYFIADCAIKLGQSNADQLMENFVSNYPSSNKTNKAFLNVANFYFDNNNYNDANKWFKRVNTANLGRDEIQKYHFNYAYTLFQNKNYDQAEKFFNRVRDDKEYGAQAKYYIGFIAYEQDEYESATELFEDAQREGVKDNISYFQSDMNFKLGNFQKAIDLGLKQLPKSNIREKSQLNKIIGESYFNLENYVKAIEYLKEYRGDRGKWNNTDYYQMGYAYYETGDYQKAIEEFSKIIDGKNFVAQNAYYHLAKAYLRTDKKTQALNAFKNVTEMGFDEELKEDAFLNYAKLSYEIGNNYQSVPEVLQSFLDAYPDSDEAGNISNLLVDSYITSKNYEKAISMLENSREYENKVAFQKVTYYYAIELFKENEYKTAKDYFNKSLSQRLEAEFTAKATFWKAETDYILGNYEEALIGYKEFDGMSKAKTLDEYSSIDYNIAYSYFKTKNYAQAKTYFESFSKSERPSQTLYDAYVRLGDSHFALGDYWPAMEAYNEAINMKDYNSDYAFFQKAYSYGFVDRNQKKIENMNAFLNKYPNSIYRDDALYELGNTYASEDQDDKAIQSYQTIISDFENSVYYTKALSKQSLIYYNNENYDKALSQFKNLVAKYPNSQESLQAIQTVRLIYIDLGKTDEYAEWVRGLDFVEVADSDIEEATYEAAENKFLDNETDKAIKGFEKYLDEFPNGKHSLNANFYLAQLYYNNDQKSASVPHYENVVDRSSSEFTEESLRRLSQIYLSESEYDKAINVLQRLENEASFSENVLFAQNNLMKAYYETEAYQKAINYAEDILKKDNIDDEVISDAKIFIARASLEVGDEDRAASAYREVLETANGKLKAEALYYDAYFKNKAEEHEASNEVVQEITKNYSRYREFSVKSLIIMAKNFHALDDAYSTTYTLESVIKNFKNFPEITEEAEILLKDIKAKAAETNASVEVEEKTKTENSDETNESSDD
ncbi:MAG: tetratricopeptide repeat protein [Psychroflexus sp.]